MSAGEQVQNAAAGRGEVELEREMKDFSFFVCLILRRGVITCWILLSLITNKESRKLHVNAIYFPMIEK